MKASATALYQPYAVLLICEPFSALLSVVVHVAVHSTLHFIVPLTSYLLILQSCPISVCAICPLPSHWPLLKFF